VPVFGMVNLPIDCLLSPDGWCRMPHHARFSVIGDSSTDCPRLLIWRFANNRPGPVRRNPAGPFISGDERAGTTSLVSCALIRSGQPLLVVVENGGTKALVHGGDSR